MQDGTEHWLMRKKKQNKSKTKKLFEGSVAKVLELMRCKMDQKGPFVWTDGCEIIIIHFMLFRVTGKLELTPAE